MVRVRLKQHKKKRQAQVSRNLHNYPIARSKMTRSWKWSKAKDGWWIGEAPRNIGFSIEMPPDVPSRCRRAPTGFDMNVLLWLLAEARDTGKVVISVPSYSQFLQQLDTIVDSYNRRRLKEALEYWSSVDLVFAKWRLGKSYIEKRIQPPVRWFKSSEHKIEIKIDLAFIELSDGGFFRDVPLPLPNDEAAQNLILLVRAYDDYLYRTSRVREIRHKMGIANHGRRNEVLDHAIKKADAWFRRRLQRKLNCEFSSDGKFVTFSTTKVTRVMREEQQQQPRVFDVTDELDQQERHAAVDDTDRSYDRFCEEHIDRDWYRDKLVRREMYLQWRDGQAIE